MSRDELAAVRWGHLSECEEFERLADRASSLGCAV